MHTGFVVEEFGFGFFPLDLVRLKAGETPLGYGNVAVLGRVWGYGGELDVTVRSVLRRNYGCEDELI